MSAVLKTLLSCSLILLTVLYTTAIIIGRTVEGFLFFEILMMILPYLLVVNAFVLLFIVLVMKLQVNSLSSMLMLQLSFSFLILTVLSVAMISWIYGFSYQGQASAGKKEAIKVGFFNKFYGNKNYTQMQKSIQNSKADILGLSEVTKGDLKHIASTTDYPYLYKETYRGLYLVVLSNYPLTVQRIADADNSLVANGKINGEEYTFIVTHPVAALAPHMLLERNEELRVLSSYMSSRKDTNLVLLGDLNTPPWSSSLVKFISSVGGLKNAAKGQGLSYTWTLGPIKTQIDHILVSEGLQVLSYMSVPVPGSDHYLLTATLAEV